MSKKVCEFCNQEKASSIYVCAECLGENNREERKQGAKKLFDWLKEQQPENIVCKTTNNERMIFILERTIKKYLKDMK